jgi:hypothetical protein
MVNQVQTLYGTFDEKQLKSLKGYIEEMVVCMSRVKSTTQSMNDIVGLAHDELNIPKKIIKRMAKVQFNQSLQEEVAEFKEFEALFESIKDVK